MQLFAFGYAIAKIGVADFAIQLFGVSIPWSVACRDLCVVGFMCSSIIASIVSYLYRPFLRLISLSLLMTGVAALLQAYSTQVSNASSPFLETIGWITFCAALVSLRQARSLGWSRIFVFSIDVLIIINAGMVGVQILMHSGLQRESELFFVMLLCRLSLSICGSMIMVLILQMGISMIKLGRCDPSNCPYCGYPVLGIHGSPCSECGCI